MCNRLKNAVEFFIYFSQVDVVFVLVFASCDERLAEITLFVKGENTYGTAEASRSQVEIILNLIYITFKKHSRY